MFHHIYACKSNIGDWLSALAIQRMLHPSAFVEYLCDEPFIEATIGRLEKLPEGEVVVIGGGGLLMDYFDPFWREFGRISHRFQVCIWGAGSCDHKQKPTLAQRELLQRVISTARVCVVRDDRTAAQFGIRSDPVPCPSMTVIETGASAAPALLHVTHYDVVGASAWERAHSLCSSFAARTGRAYRQSDNTLPDGRHKPSDLQAALDVYGEADLVVSSRLHGCIIGVSLGRKVLAISNDHKIDEFMRLAGLQDWVCDPGDLGGFEEKLQALHLQPDRSDFVSKVRKDNQRVAQAVSAVIFETVPA